MNLSRQSTPWCQCCFSCTCRNDAGFETCQKRLVTQSFSSPLIVQTHLPTCGVVPFPPLVVPRGFSRNIIGPQSTVVLKLRKKQQIKKYIKKTFNFFLNQVDRKTRI